MHKHNNPAETAVVVYGLDHNGDRGKVKGLKNKTRVPNATCAN